MEQVNAAPPLTAKPAVYQPVPTVEMNANYPVSLLWKLIVRYIDLFCMPPYTP